MPAVKRPPSPELFLRAAEARARGLSWEKAAEEVNRTVKTVRDWVRKYPREWRRALRQAEAQQLQEATAESMLTLRRQLRSDDEKTTREAAATLIKFAATRRKPPASRGKSRTTSALEPHLLAIAEFVGGLNDVEITTLLRELRQTPLSDGAAVEPAASHVASPA